MGDARRQGKPWRATHSRHIDKPHEPGNDIAHDDATYHGHQLEEPASKDEYQYGSQERDKGQQPVLLCHIDGSRRQRQSDADNHRPDDNRREQPF